MKQPLLLLIILLCSVLIFSQTSDSTNRRTGILNSNSIHTIFTNTGIIGEINQTPSGSWNYNSNSYFSDMSILIGVQLPIKDYNNDSLPDTIHSIIITPVNRPGGGEFGSSGKFWGFEPVPGFFNENQNSVALSNLPNTWPSLWPDHPEYGNNVWNGLFGLNTFVGDQESYFKIDDSNDEEMFLNYGFLPDTSQPNIKGQGISVTVRYVELNNPLFKDVLFRIYNIKNNSSYNYSKIVFGGLTGTYIGGSGDEYDDDVSLFYPNDNLIVSSDFDNHIRPSANPNWKGRVGMFGEAFIASPGVNKIKSFDYLVPGSNIILADDENIWQKLTPGKYTYPSSVLFDNDSIPYAVRGEDGDYLFGSNYFSLDSGAVRTIVSVLAYGYSENEILQKSKTAEALYYSNFDTLAIKQAVQITNPSYHKILKGNETINWSSVNNNGTVEIWFTPDAGKTWKAIERNLSNTGSYTLNTNLLEDCSFGKIRIYIKNDDGNIYGFSESNYFTIDNSSEAKPFVKILNDEFNPDSIFTQEDYNFKLLLGDSKDNPLTLNIYYSTTDDSVFYLSKSEEVQPDTLPQNYNVNFSLMPNSSQLKIKIEVKDGSQSFLDITPAFNKQNTRENLSKDHYVTNGYYKVPVKFRVIDSTQFTNDPYRVTFDDTTFSDKKTFSVFNKTESKYELKNFPLIPFSESPVFGGISLYTEDIQTQLDENKSGWNSEDTLNLGLEMSQFNFQNIKGYKYPFDYLFVFSDSYNDSSNEISALGSSSPSAKTNINFKIFDITDIQNPKRIKFAFADNTKDDTLSYNDIIVLSDDNGSAISWRIAFTGSSLSKIPGGGDSLFIYTKKGLSFLDTLEVSNLITSVNDFKSIPNNFTLKQNYPNPFNPSTIIEYNIPIKTNVKLIIYDILGRKVASLINETQNPGSYKIQFNSNKIRNGLSSGVYFYQLKAGDFIKTKKFILLK